MPPKPAQKKKKPAAQQKKKTTKTTKANKDKAKGGNKGKTTKPVKKKTAATTAATKAAKDAATKTAATGAAAATSGPAGKGKGGTSAQTRAETLPEVRDAPDESWMRDHPNGTDDDGDPEAEDADDEEEEEGPEEDDEIARYFDKLEARVLSTLSDLPYHVTSITETVRNAFRQHRMAMPIPEAALPHLSGVLPPCGVPPRYQRARYDLSSGTPSSVPTMSGWSSRTGTFLNEEFGRSGRWETMEEEGGSREEEEEGTGGGRRQVLTEEEIYKTVQSYSAEIRRELSWSMRESPRRCRSASIDRLVAGRPTSGRQRIGGCSCKNNDGTGDVDNDVVTSSRPLTASSRAARLVRPRTARVSNSKDFDKEFRKSVSKPPIPQARPSSRATFSGIRHARSTSSVNAVGTSVTASSSRSQLTPEGHSPKVAGTGSTNQHDNEEGGDRQQDASNGRMSLSELPPISGAASSRRPRSGRSRRSSTHSQGSGTVNGRGQAAETTEIVALNGYGETTKMTKRGTRSPGSTGGSSGQAPSNGTGTGTSPRISGTGKDGSTDGGINFRAKSWCSPEGGSMATTAAATAASGKADSKLETLFEQKVQRRVSDSNTPKISNGVGGQESGELFKRTKSFNNLAKGAGGNGGDIHSKTGAQSKAGTQNKSRTTGGLTKVSSEQNIASMSKRNQTPAVMNTSRRRNVSSSQVPNINKLSVSNQHKSLRVSKSTPNFKGGAGGNDPSSPPAGTPPNDDPRRHHPAGYHNNNDTGGETERSAFSEDPFADDVDPEEGEREQRIIDWLIGVESERPERPPSPSIIDEEPTQTDTAIHIIYDGE